MGTIDAIYEGGVFRPLDPVVLPEKSRVQLRIVNGEPVKEGVDMAPIYEILDRRYSSGYTDTAERHNEHQP